MGALAKAHYSRALKQHMFQMLGSLEAFGNPVGLVRGMGQVSSITYISPFLFDQLKTEVSPHLRCSVRNA
jgi:Vacuolar-sorting-associated 13 protein C-terminal